MRYEDLPIVPGKYFTVETGAGVTPDPRRNPLWRDPFVADPPEREPDRTAALSIHRPLTASEVNEIMYCAVAGSVVADWSVAKLAAHVRDAFEVFTVYEDDRFRIMTVRRTVRAAREP